jgi:hypothetical protein
MEPLTLTGQYPLRMDSRSDRVLTTEIYVREVYLIRLHTRVIENQQPLSFCLSYISAGPETGPHIETHL